MNIKFLNAERATFNAVKAHYELQGKLFTVEWNNVNGDYDLQLNTLSKDSGLANRIDDAIREGETSDNNDLDLYLFIRDTFDAGDCQHIK